MTKIPFGVFAGGPNGSDPTAEAAVNAQLESFVSATGVAPAFMDGYIDQGQSIDQWASNASWTAWSWSQTPLAAQATPVIGLPMATSADTGNPDPVFKAFASGQYDAVLNGMVEAWKDQGFTTQYWRPGYEFNVTSMPWYVGTDPGTQADYISAFQHISSVLHSAGQADGVNIQVVWSPNVQNWNGGLNVASLYPGNQAVDVIGPDEYDNMYPRDLYDWAKNDGTVDSSFAQWASNPVNIEHYFSYPDGSQAHPTGDGQGNSMSLPQLIDMAKADGKPIALSETGAGGGGGSDIPDDPAFVQWLSTELQNSGVPVSYVNVWDDNDDGNWDFSSPSAGKPLESAAWQQYFGSGAGDSSAAPAAPSGPAAPANTSAPTPATVTIGSGPDIFALGIAEDAYNGDGQYTVSVDGQPQGGIQTSQASQSAGQVQTVDVEGSFGAGAHTVSVDFLNDAYGGSPSADRNLYVDSLSYNGVQDPTGQAALMSSGPVDFSVPASAGQDTITFDLTEDAYQGDAQVALNLDGKTLGTPTVTFLNTAGTAEAFTYTGSFGGSGVTHTAGVDFLNDLYGGTPDTDRNVYVKDITFDGTSHPDLAATLYAAGPANFVLPAS